MSCVEVYILSRAYQVLCRKRILRINNPSIMSCVEIYILSRAYQVLCR